MKHQWFAYVIVALLSIGAGIAIAGLPDNTPVAATIVASTTTIAAAPTSEAATTTVETTAPETTAPDATSSTTTGAPTTTSTTGAPTTTSTTAPPGNLPPRSELTTIVANGANISGAAGRNVELLTAIGYTDIAPRNGTAIVEFTIVYYADGLEDAALRLAEDLDLLPEFIAPLIDAPQVLDLPDDVELLAYIGLDRAR